MTDSLRILLTDRGLLNGYTLGLAGGLQQNGVKPYIGGPARSGEPAVTPIYPASTPGDAARKPFDAFRGIVHFRRLLARRPDFVHFQWPTTLDAAFALMARRLYEVPLAYTVHNFHRAGDGRQYEASQRRLIALADLVFTHGPSLRAAIVGTHPAAAAKTHVIEHGNYEHVIVRYPRSAAREAMGVPRDGPLYVFVGQIRPRKGIEILIETFAEHRRRGRPGQLLIAGNATVPEYARRLRELTTVCESEVHWQVSALPVPRRTLDLAISAASQIVLPFHDASQSGAVILGLTHGRCVVSTAVGEIPRTLRDRGITVEPRNRADLLAAMAIAANNPEYCDQLGKLGRDYALTELSWRRVAAQTIPIYESLCR